MLIILVAIIAVLLVSSCIYVKPQFTIDEDGYLITITVYFLMKLLKLKRQIGPEGIRKPGHSNGKVNPVKKNGLSDSYVLFRRIKD